MILVGLVIAKRVESADRDEDRIAVVQKPWDRTIIIVADGAGGTSGGAKAADAVCNAASQEIPEDSDQALVKEDAWSIKLARIDRRLGERPEGESTAVVVDIRSDVILGASVGDSIAWLVSSDGKILDLTANQLRKPLVGRGKSCPVGFGPLPLSGRLLVATDGLWKYADRQKIASLCSRGTVEEAAASLAVSVRLPSGILQDDVAIVVCEIR